MRTVLRRCGVLVASNFMVRCTPQPKFSEFSGGAGTGNSDLATAVSATVVRGVD
jgi:hypothetical protein